MPFDCVVRAVEQKVVSSFPAECSLHTAFIEYLKECHDLLMYRHSFMFALKKLDPMEIAMQLINNKESALYFCDLTSFLLMDSLNLKGTIFTPKESTSSFQFDDHNKFDVVLSNISCMVVGGKVYILDGEQKEVKTCPIKNFLTHKYSAPIDVHMMELPKTHVLGIHGAGKICCKVLSLCVT